MSELTPIKDETHKGCLVLRHLQAEGSCMFGAVLADRGYRMKTMNSTIDDLNEIDPLRPDILIVMGGPIGVYQAEHYPFLKQEMAVLKTRIEADLPTIGVCLGAQLIAQAAGSTVYKGDAGKEVGWIPLEMTDAAKACEFRHFDSEKTNMFHWHGDTFDLPDNATLMASSRDYQNQIFTIGQNICGFQCHPEVTASQLPEWFVMFVNQITGPNAVIDIETLRADTDRYIDALNAQSKLFFEEWLDKRGL